MRMGLKLTRSKSDCALPLIRDEKRRRPPRGPHSPSDAFFVDDPKLLIQHGRGLPL